MAGRSGPGAGAGNMLAIGQGLASWPRKKATVGLAMPPQPRMRPRRPRHDNVNLAVPFARLRLPLRRPPLPTEDLPRVAGRQCFVFGILKQRGRDPRVWPSLRLVFREELRKGYGDRARDEINQTCEEAFHDSAAEACGRLGLRGGWNNKNRKKEKNGESSGGGIRAKTFWRTVDKGCPRGSGRNREKQGRTKE